VRNVKIPLTHFLPFRGDFSPSPSFWMSTLGHSEKCQIWGNAPYL